MTQERPNQVTPSGTIPNNPNPNDGKGIPFSLSSDSQMPNPEDHMIDSFGRIRTIVGFNQMVRENNAIRDAVHKQVDEELSEEQLPDDQFDEDGMRKLYDPEIYESPTQAVLSERSLGVGSGFSFNPVYYPDRFSDTMEKEVNRNGRQCGGEDVSIDKTKNPEFHATGIVLDGNVSDFRKIRKHKGPVNLITPLTDNEGGMEVVVTKGEIGEIVGWDGLYKQWQFSYTLDMVATGSDTDESSQNQIVSEVLAEYRE